MTPFVVFISICHQCKSRKLIDIMKYTILWSLWGLFSWEHYGWETVTVYIVTGSSPELRLPISIQSKVTSHRIVPNCHFTIRFSCYHSPFVNPNWKLWPAPFSTNIVGLLPSSIECIFDAAHNQHFKSIVQRPFSTRESKKNWTEMNSNVHRLVGASSDFLSSFRISVFFLFNSILTEWIYRWMLFIS